MMDGKNEDLNIPAREDLSRVFFVTITFWSDFFWVLVMRLV